MSEQIPKKISYEEEIPAYKDSMLSIDDRTKDLLLRMTLEEKVAQMQCIWETKTDTILDEKNCLDFDKLRKNLPCGIGHIGRLSDTGEGLNSLGKGVGPVEMVEMANALQKFFLEETRLGIPALFHEECLHGLAAVQATSYPQPIGMAATFNPGLIREIYSSISEDTRNRGAHQALMPVLDVARDARWGRVEETFGEDPFLISKMGMAAVNGIQNDGNINNKSGLLATLKHFAVHGQPESGTNCGPANYSERIIREVFLFPFKEAVQKAKVRSIMPSYNEIDGVPSHANKWLLTDVLRNEWGFEGFLVSDYYAISELYCKEETTGHYLASNYDEAGALAVRAGVNLEMPDPKSYKNLSKLVVDKVINETEIDNLVYSILKSKFELGLFDDPYIWKEKEYFTSKLESDRVLALNAARETITLLKNKNELLPLDRNKIKKLSVIGPNADRELLGGYSGVPKYNVTVLEGIKEKVGNDIEVLYSKGCEITIGGSWTDDEVVLPAKEDDAKLLEEAVNVGKQSDVIILILGGNEQTSREAWNKEHMGDRTSLELIGNQNKLAQELKALRKPIVVLLFHGRPNSINYIYENIDAILECWYLGQESGHAVADVIFGDFNPGGKLPISIPRSVGHLPCFYNHKPSARRGYLFDDTSPLLPFGYGLSYTKFSVDNLLLDSYTTTKDKSVNVSIEVKNEGEIKGTEVIQLYIRDLVSSVTRPIKELKGFEKVSLSPGESRIVTFEITPELLSFYDINMNYIVEPGEFEIMVGNSSRDDDLQKIILNVV